MTIAFENASYLSQVRRLRALANKALAEYPIKVKALKFIQNGENATFRVLSTKGQTYLLRIHRKNYHTKPAILEEIAWLDHLTKKGLSVPSPPIDNSERHFREACCKYQDGVAKDSAFA